MLLFFFFSFSVYVCIIMYYFMMVVRNVVNASLLLSTSSHHYCVQLKDKFIGELLITSFLDEPHFSSGHRLNECSYFFISFLIADKLSFLFIFHSRSNVSISGKCCNIAAFLVFIKMFDSFGCSRMLLKHQFFAASFAIGSTFNALI